MTAPAKPWLIYVRVSTEDQAREGVSLDAQRVSCEAMAKALSHTVAEVITDAGLSAKDLSRPGVQRTMAEVDSGRVAGVIIYKLDRLTRSRRDLEDLLDRFKNADAGLISVSEKLDTSSPMGRFFVAMLGAIAQWERETIAERVQMGMNHSRAKGRFVGGQVPAGMITVPAEGGGKRIEPCLTWGPVVAKVWQMVCHGASLRQVAEYLTKSGLPARVRWSPTSARKILVSTRYIGHLVSAETHSQAVATLRGRLNPHTKEGVSHAAASHSLRPWILSGIAKCGECGSSLIGVTSRNASGRVYHYYRCTKRAKHGAKACGFRDIAAEPWEAAVIRNLVESAKADGPLRPALLDSVETSTAAAAPLNAELGKLTSERDRTQIELNNLAKMAAEGGLTAQALANPIADRQKTLNRLAIDIAQIQGQAAAAKITKDGAEGMLEAMRGGLERLPDLPPQEQSDAAHIMIRKVVLSQIDKQTGEIHLTVNLPRLFSGTEYVYPCPLVDSRLLRTGGVVASWKSAIRIVR